MSHFSNLRDGELTEFKRILAEYGFTAEIVRAINKTPEIAADMFAVATKHPSLRLVHGRFTPLADKIAMVKEWPGINPEDVDAALATAMDNGTIAGYEAEVGKNPLLDIVVTVYRESIPATLVYARERMREAWEGKYSEWVEAYAQNVDDDRVKAIEGAKQFFPNRIVIEVVNFGANWDRQNGLVLETVQKAQAPKLADFAVIYNTVESPKWVEQMDGEKVPYALVAALLLNVPGLGSWRCSPRVWHSGGRAGLGGGHVERRFYGSALPVLREYKR